MGDRRFEIGLIAAYALVAYGMIPFHEPWRDEAQAWLIARDLDLSGLLAQMRYELSPPLWHLLLWPFAHLGLPFATAHVLNATATVVAVALVALASPFARWQKVAFAGCFLMAFEYGVVARSYGSSAMLAVAIAAVHPRRFERPGIYVLLILVLAATNLHALVLALGFGASYAWELFHRSGGVAGLLKSRLAIGALAGFAILGAWAAASELLWRILRVAFQIGYPGLESTGSMLSRAFLSPLDPSPWTITLAGATLLAAIVQLRRSPPALIVLLLPVAFYTLSPLSKRATFRHAGFILLAVLVALWIERRESAVGPAGDGGGDAAPAPAPWWRRFATSSAGLGGILVFGCLALTVSESVRFLHGDVTGRSSASRDMARYIDENAIRGPIAARRASTASALLPYLPGRRFWYLDVEEWGTFVTWKRGVFARLISEATMAQRLHERFGDDRPWLLTTRPLRRPGGYGYELAHSEDELGPSQRGYEVYYLYRPRYW